MQRENYPDLFLAADREAARKQALYFRLLVVQYLSLFIASALTLLTIYFDQKQVLIGYLVMLIIGSIAALLLATLKPHQQWYQMRALAESCKTLTWRYMMSAEPFSDRSDTSKASVVLAERLHELTTFQNLNASVLVHDLGNSEQATKEMKRVHELDYESRQKKYLEDRIDNQLNWYKMKAAKSKRASTIASVVVVLIYVAAILLAIFQVVSEVFPKNMLWISEPLLVLAASFLGYAQAKRFAELSSSYALTALEIQKLRSGFLAVKDEQAFVVYVNEAENAFSREHTQWIARVV